MKPGFLLILLALVLGTILACALLTITVYPSPVPTIAATPTRTAPPGKFQIEVNGVSVGETVSVTLTVRASGPQALLFDTPLLAGEIPAPESLEQARVDLLDLATSGQAQITLEFPRPAQDPPWMLVFNPAHAAENVVAPRVEIEINPDGQ